MMGLGWPHKPLYPAKLPSHFSKFQLMGRHIARVIDPLVHVSL